MKRTPDKSMSEEKIKGQRLKTIRLSRGWSLETLSRHMDPRVSKQMLSRYELGISGPTPRIMTALSKALQVAPAHLLEEPHLDIQPVAYRKEMTLRPIEQNRIRALLTTELEQRSRVQEVILAKKLDLPILSLPSSTLEEAEAAAMKIRHIWGLGDGPIMSLVDEFENHLVHVIEIKAPLKFDGLSLIAFDEEKRPTAVAAAVRRGVSGDRQRFSLAHELGHIVLKPSSAVDEEKAAHRFASAFLAPAGDLLREVGEKRNVIEMEELVMLKNRYKMSLSALVHRLNDLGVINRSYTKEWYMHLRAQGWWKVEPHEVPREEPTWLKKNVQRAVSEGLIPADLATSLLKSIR